MNSTARGTHESPNIYTREFDLSGYSTKSIGATTLGVVGETLIGPAFQPVSISTFNEFQTYFGGTSPEKYANGYPRYELPYIAKSYLQQSQQLYVTRVLGLSGYQHKGMWVLGLTTLTGTTSGSTGVYTNSAFATIRSKATYNGDEDLIASVSGVTIDSESLNAITGIDVNFNIVVSVTNGETETYNVSLNPINKNYILKVLGTSPKTSSSSKIYVEEMYEDVINNAIFTERTNGFYDNTTISFTSEISGIQTFNDYRVPFSYAKTPWFVSELKGHNVIPLFRFLTLSDGENANNLFKISIKNIDITGLKFDVLIRDINDTDARPIIYEQFTNCTLDPLDGNAYLGAKIGTVDEVYQLKSKYVIVEIIDDPKVKESIPMGIEGYLIKDFTNQGYTTPIKLTYNTEFIDTGSLAAKKPYFGISDKTGYDSDIFTYKGVSGLTLTKGFHLEPSVNSVDTTGVTFTDPTNNLKCQFDVLDEISYNSALDDNKKLMKFTVLLAGGFDGWDIFRENRTNSDDYQYNRYKSKYPTKLGDVFGTFNGNVLSRTLGIPDIPVSTGMTSDFYAFWSAARAFTDTESYDINVFTTPGIDWVNNEILTNEIIDFVENERKDSIYIMTTPDKPTYAGDSKSEMYTSDDIVSLLESSDIDSSYTATYYPWCQYYDSDNGVYVYLPPTKDVVKNIAYTDNAAYSWFPPAGIGRGSVDCVKAKKNLILGEEDTLYAGRINVIKTFALDGVKIWGQKTLQIADTALNRIGTRRMMLYLRKQVRRSNLPLIFEPNDNTTKNKFLEIVNPILNNVKTNRGLSEYKIIIDDSSEAKARHEMNVQIWIKPIGALEYINIDFMITAEGFDFSTI